MSRSGRTSIPGVRMSMSIPFFWPDVPWDPAWGNYQGASITGDEMVDGGVTSNFALRLRSE